MIKMGDFNANPRKVMKERGHENESVARELDGDEIWREMASVASHRGEEGLVSRAKVGELPPSSGLSIDRSANSGGLTLAYRPPLWRVLQARFNRRVFDKGLGLIVLLIVGLGVMRMGPAMDMAPQERLMFTVMGLASMLAALGGFIAALTHLARWTAPRRLEI